MEIIRKSQVLGILVVCIIIVALVSCGKNDRIEGQVKDIFGNPLSGVTVRIEKTTFSAQTDASGRYSLDYAPGSIKLIFSKKGYTTRDLTLNIQQKVHFPAETMILFPIPAKTGIFYINFDRKQLVKLAQNAKIRKKTIKRRGYFLFSPSYFFIRMTINRKPKITRGSAMFILTVQYLVVPTKVERNGLFCEWNLAKGITYSGFLEEGTVRYIGKEKLLVVKYDDLKPGLYAWVQMQESSARLDELIPRKNGAAFVFDVIEISPKNKKKSEKSSGLEL